MNNTASRSSSSHPVFRRIVLVLLAIVLILAAAGFFYENISEARDRRFNPMEGRLVDVGGRKMHIHCTGDGSPTVILDSGLGDSYLSWRKVQPQIAKFTRVCSYDRAGLGYSDPSHQSRTSKVIAEELHALVQAAGISPPYVIVGTLWVDTMFAFSPACTAMKSSAWFWWTHLIPTRRTVFPPS